MGRSSRFVAVDQLIVSGCNFFFVLLLARFFSPQLFGSWVLWNAGILYLNTSSSAFVVTPLATLVPQADAQRRLALVQRSLGLQLIWCTGCAVLVVAALVATTILDPEANLIPSASALVAAQLSFQMHDWVRRIFFSIGRTASACLVDTLAYGTQLLGFAYIANRRAPSLNDVLYVSAASFAIGFSVGALILRIAPRIRNHLDETEFLKMGRAYFLAGQLQWVGAQGGFFVASAFLGTASVGALRAVQTILSPITVLFQALDNVIPVRAASLMASHGRIATVTYLLDVGKKVGLFVITYVVCTSIAASSLLSLLFGKYEDRQLVLALNGAALGAALLWRLGVYLKRSERDLTAILRSNLTWAVCTVLSTLILVQSFGEVGVMLGAILSTLIATAILMLSRDREN